MFHFGGSVNTEQFSINLVNTIFFCSGFQISVYKQECFGSPASAVYSLILII